LLLVAGGLKNITHYMPAKFQIIDPKKINDNTFKLIGEDWMLIAAGTPKSYNMMTASWGAQGVLWNKNVFFCFIRPHRHTYQFMENSKYFTVNFFEEKFRDLLNLCGTKSGKAINKMKIEGLTGLETENGSVYFNEASMVIECKKIYFQDIKPENFISRQIQTNYPKKDYHRMYIGEVINCYKKA
jgi:flavin reductase (DIM6/NTAB) family NADH-FMN oxidoreductase RutF